MIYSVLSITTRATSLSAVTMMQSLSFLRFSSAKCFALVMFVCICVGPNNSIDIMGEITADEPKKHFTVVSKIHHSTETLTKTESLQYSTELLKLHTQLEHPQSSIPPPKGGTFFN